MHIIQANQMLHSTKNNITYGVVSVGQPHLYDNWQKKNNQWLRIPTMHPCQGDEVLLQELQAWGKLKVFKAADIQAAITAGTIKLITI